MKNIEKDYAKSVSITFRQHPLAQHRHAREAARAAEAAGLQGRFWEMHDLLYLKRSDWVRCGGCPRVFQYNAPPTSDSISSDSRKTWTAMRWPKRIAADEDRGASLGIDRTPVVFINGKKVEFSPQPEDGLRAEIDAALGAKAQ